jgi:hypothetical protein
MPTNANTGYNTGPSRQLLTTSCIFFRIFMHNDPSHSGKIQNVLRGLLTQ